MPQCFNETFSSPLKDDLILHYCAETEKKTIDQITFTELLDLKMVVQKHFSS